MALTKVSRGLLTTSIVDNGNATAITIDASENVGIGTSSPEATAHLSNAVAAGSDNLALRIQNPTNAADARVGIGFHVNAVTGSGWDGAYIQSANTGSDSGDLRFGSVTNNTLTEAMRISDGNLLVNTGSFGSLGTLVIKQLSDTKGLALVDDGSTNTFFIQNLGSEARISHNDTSPMTFLTNSAERMRIDASGNLLVGKTVGNSPTAIGFEVQQDGEVYSSVATGYNTYHVYANSGYRFYVNPNGGLYNYSANNVNLSDEREKKNIEALESQWDSLRQWSLKKFHYNADADSDTKKLGVIAQEVEVHNPEVISEFSVDEDTTRMAVKEQQMMWMAIKALQEAQERIETLEAKVQTLENN